MLTDFKALMRPILEYNCEIWNPHKIKDICEIEKIQRAFTHRISQMNEFDYWQRLQKLEILS